MYLTPGALVDALGGQLHGDRDLHITGLAALSDAAPDQLSFISSRRYLPQLSTSNAGCVIVGPDLQEHAMAHRACIVVAQPYLYFARITQLWKRQAAPLPGPSIHATAVIDPAATVDPSATIGPLCVIGRGARIGAATVLKAAVHVGEDCRVGARCLLHPGVVIGADGFGFAPDQGVWEKIEQLGAVVIGDDVEIGANTCVDRGALMNTVIEDGVKLDNLIQIGHNVRVGKHTAIAACAGVAGSASIGAHCTIGGAAVVLGHLVVGDHVHISAASVVTRSILKPGHYSGLFPIDDNARWEKNAAALKRLHNLRERLRTLERYSEHGMKP